MLTEKEINTILSDIHRGKITLENLPVGLYLENGKLLQQAIYQGFGMTLKQAEFESPAWKTINELRNNAYRFSGVKTFHNVKDIQALLFDEKGYLKGFDKFVKEARTVYDVYNVNYLETERSTAISQADSAAKWQDFEAEKETFPLLQYKAIMDDNTRPEHAALNGITLPVNDTFWNSCNAPNGFNCRCELIQIRSMEEITPLHNDKREELIRGIPPMFRNNPGVSKVLFMENGANAHPYYTVPEKYRTAKQRNFDLPIPKP